MRISHENRFAQYLSVMQLLVQIFFALNLGEFVFADVIAFEIQYICQSDYSGVGTTAAVVNLFIHIKTGNLIAPERTIFDFFADKTSSKGKIVFYCFLRRTDELLFGNMVLTLPVGVHVGQKFFLIFKVRSFC